MQVKNKAAIAAVLSIPALKGEVFRATDKKASPFVWRKQVKGAQLRNTIIN